MSREIEQFGVNQGAAGWPMRISVPRVREHELRAKVAEMKRRGEIRPDEVILRREGTDMAAYVMRLKPMPRRWPRVAGWSALAAGIIAGGLALLWESRYFLLTLAFAAAGIWWAATRSSHSGACPGLHCSGCRN